MKIRGEFGADPVRHYKEPLIVFLSYAHIDKDPFPTPQEAQVFFNINGGREYAFVPLSIVNENDSTVEARLVGEQMSDGRVLVTFPPTNFGQTKFLAHKEALESIVRASYGPIRRRNLDRD